MDLLETFELLKIKSIPNVWVHTVWELDFTETEPLDYSIEGEITEHGLEAFKKVYKCLLPFATDGQGNTESVWSWFSECNVSPGALVALLYHFVQLVQNKKASVPQRESALHAAGLYFLLLEIPGSVANRIFHPVLFDKCLDTLKKSWPQESESARKRKKDVVKSSQSEPKGRKRARPIRRDESEIDEEFDDDDQEETVYFSGQDLLQVREGIFSLLKNLIRLLPRFPLKDKPQSVQHCLQILIELTNFEPVIGLLDFTGTPDVTRMKTLPELAYHGLRLLCSPMHGEGDQTVRRVFHRILYVILMMSAGEGSNPVLLAATQHVVSAREQAVRFVSHIVDELKETVLPVFRILLQHICAKVTDKADYRTYGAQALVKLLSKLPCVEYAAFIKWLYNYSRHTKIPYRVFALDVAMALLEQPERQADEAVPPEQVQFLQHRFLIQVMVLGRCSDKAPTVRSRALSSLAQCLELQTATAVGAIQELLQGTSGRTVDEEGLATSPDNSEASASATHNQQKTLGGFKTIEVTKRADATVSEAREIIAMLRLRAGDEKTSVRKSAVQVFSSLLKYSVIPCTPEDLSTVQDRCRDPAVSVRKQAVQSLTELLTAQPGNRLVQKAWLTGVVPVVLDAENSLQEKALDCLDQAILHHIKCYDKYSNDDSHQKLAWDLLEHLGGESQELCRYLTKAFHIWSKQDKFSSSFINNLISHTETEHSAAAWMLLAKVAGSSPKLNYSKIIEAWDNISREQNTSTSTTCHVLCVIGHVAKHLSEDTKRRLVDDIMKWLKAFHSPLVVVSAAVAALRKLGQSESLEETLSFLNWHCGQLVSLCDSYLSNIVLNKDGTACLDEDLVVKYIFTLGEAALLCPSKVEKRIFLLIQSILASNVNLEPSAGDGDSEDLLASQPLSQFKASAMPTVVRAHAFITLGKLCLQNEDLAKKCIPALAQELELCEDVSIRNNVIIVMCDLCVRYTTMVDRYIPNIAMSLKDREPSIRKQTLIMLTNLLQEEFVKWKESLFFRFVSVLVDPDPSIARLSEFCLVHLLLKRNPVMFSQHFIECIFHFNGYEKHEKYNKFPQTEREKNLFSLKGSKNKEKRMKIYKFLLDHFTDEQRFNITTKISQNVLASFVDGLVPLDKEASDLLSDTFEVLRSREIKLSTMRSKPGEEVQPEDDEIAMATAVMQVAQKKLISQVQKKNFIENVIPIITSLKSMLEQMRIPALRELMSYLREMMQDYRNEISDFFAVDKQLAAELEYDMKKYEEQLEKEREAEDMSSAIQPDMAAAPGTPRPSPHGSPAAAVSVSGGVRAQTPGAAASPQGAAAGSAGTPLQPQTPSAAVFTSPRPVVPRARQMSLSTAAILNSAKKVAETLRNQRSRCVSAVTPAPSRENSPTSKPGSLRGRDLRLSSSNSSMVERAISTPDKTIENVTFNAGVSYISMSGSEKRNSEKTDQNVLCLVSPDKLAPPPRQWNVESPVSVRQTRRGNQRKTALKPAN
ncbi:condensin-2 complex subunit D3 [Polyodon spathula]|uniref:condensin-2 complex subunit D3 n=1 Tax=Polyodon spathula TaxID=7913 RepID=UPI001B7DD4D3|nr:condensin-2 complex subunit D3 [Polyodon spathula]